MKKYHKEYKLKYEYGYTPLDTYEDSGYNRRIVAAIRKHYKNSFKEKYQMNPDSAGMTAAQDAFSSTADQALFASVRHQILSENQYWIFRVLLAMNYRMSLDISGYRKAVQAENRNRIAYLLDWMTDGKIKRDTPNRSEMIREYQRSICEERFRKECKTLSGRFLNEFKEFMDRVDTMNYLMSEIGSNV